MARRGRYFEPESSPGPPAVSRVKCFNCNQFGHVRYDCPHQVCRYCTAIDDHPSHRCPERLHCSYCSQTGHVQTSCPFTFNRDDPSEPCGMCGDYGHLAATCHQIWRYYRPVTADQIEMKVDFERYCYNCAARGHLGDDCPRPRPYHIQGGKICAVVSAFGEGNVPEWARQAKPVMPKPGANRPPPPSEDEDDGWFGDRSRPERKQERRVGGIKLSKQEERGFGTNSAQTRRSNQRPPSGDEHPPRMYPPRPPPRVRSPLRPGSGDSYASNSIDSYRPHYDDRDRSGPPRSKFRKKWSDDERRGRQQDYRR